MAFTQKSLVESVPTRLLIAGSWREASGGARFEVSDPASGAVLTTCADGTPEDGLAALAAAHEAQPTWAATPPASAARSCAGPSTPSSPARTSSPP